MSKLKSIEEHNKNRVKESYKYKATGIRCPKCVKEQELYTDDSTFCRGANEQKVFCIICNYITYVLA